MMTPLNLASRPVRNDRLPALLFVTAAFALFLASLYHFDLVRRLMPSRSTPLKQEGGGLQREMENLRAQAGRMRAQPVAPAQKTEWRIIKELVDRRTFWWSELFASLEEALPPNVRILSVMPHLKDGRFGLDLVARVEDVGAGLHFVRVLEERPEFEEVYPKSVTEQGGAIEYTYSAFYLSEAVSRGDAPQRVSDAAAAGGAR
jgi:Tfp pilus assembly protein PilN